MARSWCTLDSPDGSQFTVGQAEYAAKHVGL
jgi:hypothetical protein